MGKNIDVDEFLVKLVIVDKIERGLQDLKNKKIITHKDEEQKFRQKWQK